MLKRISVLLLACACLLTFRPVTSAALEDADTLAWEKQLSEARKKYNTKTVNVYKKGKGKFIKGKFNIRYYLSEGKEPTICISESLLVNDEAEMEAILEVVTGFEDYDESVFGPVSFMKAEWFAHNLAHEMATGSENSRKWIEAFVGESLDQIISSAKELDLSPIESMSEKQLRLYRMIESLFQ